MKKVALFLISFYQKTSFIFPSRCRFIPTCSEYAKRAFTQYSFLKASQLSLCRILRCHPLTTGGFDPLV